MDCNSLVPESKKIQDQKGYGKIAMEAITPGIRRLFNRGLLCDVDVIIEGKTFSAHRIILASVSDYFRDVFAPDAHNRGEKVTVHVDGISASAFEKWLHYVYAHELDVDDDSVIEVLKSAIKTEFELLRQQCIIYMIERADDPKCTLKYLFTAQHYGMEEVAQMFLQSLSRINLQEVTQQPEFKELGRDMMCQILDKASKHRINGHLDIFRTAKAWLYRNRKRPAKKKNSFQSIPVKAAVQNDLQNASKEGRENEVNGSLNNNQNMRDGNQTTIENSVNSTSTKKTSPSHTVLNNLNKAITDTSPVISRNDPTPMSTLAKMDADTIKAMFSNYSDDDEDEDDFEVDPMEVMKYVDFRWVPRNDLIQIYESNFLHLIPELKLKVHDILFPGVAKPTHLAGFSLGKNNIALMYDLRSQDRGRGAIDGPSYCTFEHMELLNYNGCVYVCGSHRYPFIQPDIFKSLDVKTRTWKKLSRMVESGREKSIFGLEGNIFLVGGCRAIEAMGEPLDNDIIISATVERYSITHDRWCKMHDFPMRTHSMPVCVLDGIPYASGGVTDDGKEVNILYRYNVDEDMWKIIGGLKQRTSGHEMLGFEGILYFVMRDRSVQSYDVSTRQFSDVHVTMDVTSGWYLTSHHCCTIDDKMYFLDDSGVLHVLNLRDKSLENLNHKWLPTFCDYLVLF